MVFENSFKLHLPGGLHNFERIFKYVHNYLYKFEDNYGKYNPLPMTRDSSLSTCSLDVNLKESSMSKVLFDFLFSQLLQTSYI